MGPRRLGGMHREYLFCPSCAAAMLVGLDAKMAGAERAPLVVAVARRVLELEADDDAVLLAAIGLAQRTEREACAKMCDRLAAMESHSPNDFDECAAAIRARGGK